MKTFISDVSKQSFPLSEKVSAKYIRSCILDEIKKEYPNFSENNFLSLAELNKYRYQYMQQSFVDETGKISALEQRVLDAMKNNESIVEETDGSITYGQHLADKVASFGGSWRFIIIFMSFLAIWILINILMLTSKAFDPYPFILLNLILSCVAALQAPVIMMSQNRQEEKDRQRSKNDYMINLKSELEIRMLHEKIDHLIVNQQQRLMEVQEIQIEMMADIMKRLEQKAAK